MSAASARTIEIPSPDISVDSSRPDVPESPALFAARNDGWGVFMTVEEYQLAISDARESGIRKGLVLGYRMGLIHGMKSTIARLSEEIKQPLTALSGLAQAAVWKLRPEKLPAICAQTALIDQIMSEHHDMANRGLADRHSSYFEARNVAGTTSINAE